jgi:hypothetical protein
VTEHERAEPGEPGGHEEHIHLPPPSLVPIAMAASVTLTFVGLLIPVKPKVGPVIIPVLAIVGVFLVIACGIAWFRGARREYLELPE